VRRLALVDPVLYLVVVAVAFLPAGTLAITPLQAEGMATGLVFVTGLVAVWFALSERAEDDPAAPTAVLPSVGPAQPATAPEPGLFTHRHVTGSPGGGPQRSSR
jgi:hypothetical protein